MAKLALITGDQLTLSLASLRTLNPAQDWLVMAEVHEEATYVKHHKHKIALLFSAMRHFAQDLRNAGWQVDYYSYAADGPKSLLSAVEESLKRHQCTELVLTQCGEYRLQQAMDNDWSRVLGVPVSVYEDDRFLSRTADFRHWASSRKQLRMEYFYRDMRRSTGLLMEGDKPRGGQWNFDADNRSAYKGEVPIPPSLTFDYDALDKQVFAVVEEHFPDHPGSLSAFHWATTRAQALQVLEHFIQYRLPHFGRYQDAMVSSHSLGTEADSLFHSLLSPYINCDLLTALEVCNAAEQAFLNNRVPLSAAEGFIRQIIGWREYVRGIYWTFMPQYAERNALQNQRRLPGYYWSGNTGMHCMAEALRNTLTNAYAHHIQRLMVTGNFALLSGIVPADICDWYLAMYADAYDWVELPNTLGMMMHADGGLLGSKPYCASGKYIERQSDYCRHCQYNVKSAAEPDSCPFNSLYWHFLVRHRERFSANPRMSMMYRSFDRMTEEKQQRILARADDCLNQLESL